MRALKLGFWAVLFIALVTFCVTFASQNSDEMTVNLLYKSTDPIQKWKVLLCAALAGALLSALFFVVELIILESKNIVLRRVNKKMERALKQQAPAIGASPATYPTDPSLSDNDV